MKFQKLCGKDLNVKMSVLMENIQVKLQPAKAIGFGSACRAPSDKQLYSSFHRLPKINLRATGYSFYDNLASAVCWHSVVTKQVIAWWEVHGAN